MSQAAATTGWRWTSLALDSKHRAQLPDQVRKLIKPGAEPEDSIPVVAGYDPDGCIVLHSEAQHQDYMAANARMLGADGDPHTLPAPLRRAFRALAARFFKLRIDSNGRLTLPEALRERAGINPRFVIMAQDHRIELWAEERAEEIEAGEDDGLDILEQMRAEQAAARKAEPALATAPVLEAEAVASTEET